MPSTFICYILYLISYVLYLTPDTSAFPYTNTPYLVAFSLYLYLVPYTLYLILGTLCSERNSTWNSTCTTDRKQKYINTHQNKLTIDEPTIRQIIQKSTKVVIYNVFVCSSGRRKIVFGVNPGEPRGLSLSGGYGRSISARDLGCQINVRFSRGRIDLTD